MTGPYNEAPPVLATLASAELTDAVLSPRYKYYNTSRRSVNTVTSITAALPRIAVALPSSKDPRGRPTQRTEQSQPGPSARLGTYTRHVSPTSRKAASGAASRALQKHAQRLLGDEWRVSDCGKHPIPGQYVTARYHEGHERAGYAGLARCGSVWTCPVCSSIELTKRRNVLQAIERRARAKGWSVVLVTVTVQHDAGELLRDLIAALKASWRKVRQGKGWKLARDRWGIRALATSMEIRHGRHGWHPHDHALLLLDHEPDAAELADLEAWLSERYGKAIRDAGHWASSEWGVTVTGHAGTAAYLAKWGGAEELTRIDAKAGDSETPWELLERAGRGDPRAVTLFLEYADATKGIYQLTGLRALADAVGIDADAQKEIERGSEADPQQGEGWRDVVQLEPKQWEFVLEHRLDVELLQLIEQVRGSPEATWTWLTVAKGMPKVGKGEATWDACG